MYTLNDNAVVDVVVVVVFVVVVVGIVVDYRGSNDCFRRRVYARCIVLE